MEKKLMKIQCKLSKSLPKPVQLELMEMLDKGVTSSVLIHPDNSTRSAITWEQRQIYDAIAHIQDAVIELELLNEAMKK